MLGVDWNDNVERMFLRARAERCPRYEVKRSGGASAFVIARLEGRRQLGESTCDPIWVSDLNRALMRTLPRRPSCAAAGAARTRSRPPEASVHSGKTEPSLLDFLHA